MAMLQLRLFLRIASKSGEVYLLKIVSLAVTFACSTLIILFSLNEFGYDRFHSDYHSVFRVLRKNTSETHSGNRLSNRIPLELCSLLSSFSKDSMSVARIKRLEELNITVGKHAFHNQKIYAADFEITDIFSFDLLDGSLAKFDRVEPTAILSSSSALQYFGSINASGEKLKISSFNDTLIFIVAAVYKDFPKNSHEQFDSFIRFDLAQIKALSFDPKDVGIYGKVKQGSTVRHERSINSGILSNDENYILQPVSDIYFGPKVVGEDSRHGDSYSITILISITALILFLALTSFINLTTLTLPHRAKELAVKKLSGTGQFNLQFGLAIESFLVVGISLLLGILLLILLSDYIIPALAIDLVSLLLEGSVVATLILFGLVVITGISPLFISRKFTRATPNRLLSTESISFPRFKRTITIIQLGISIFLIVASLVIRRQVNYSLLKEPGRNHERVVYVNYPEGLSNEGLRNLRTGWKKNNPNIVDVMATSQLPDQVSSKEVNSGFYFTNVEPEFKDFFNINMVQGNWFKANDGDSIVVVNELGRKMLGDNARNVAGVFRDMSGQFNQPEKAMKLKISQYANYNFLCIRVLEVDIRKTVQFLSSYFGQGNEKASIKFLNKRFEEWLTYQDRLNALSKVLALISGLLSCFAIYGLSISIVRDKIKPIAIHKLCGASILNITYLLLKEFTSQMLVAILIFGPLTYIILNELLRNFAYSTHFTWLDPLFPLAFCVITITLLCGFQALSLNREDLSSALKGQ